MSVNDEKKRRMQIRRDLGLRRPGTPTPERRAGPDYLVAFACFSCKSSFKRPYSAGTWYLKCPSCGSWSIDLGRKFKPPKKTDTSQWAKVQFLVENGFVFHSVYEDESRSKRATYPRTLAEARVFVSRFRSQAISIPEPPDS